MAKMDKVVNKANQAREKDQKNPSPGKDKIGKAIDKANRKRGE